MKIKIMGHMEPHTGDPCHPASTSEAVSCCDAMADCLYPYVLSGRVWVYFQDPESGDNIGAPLVYCPWCGTPINE